MHTGLYINTYFLKCQVRHIQIAVLSLLIFEPLPLRYIELPSGYENSSVTVKLFIVGVVVVIE